MKQKDTEGGTTITGTITTTGKVGFLLLLVCSLPPLGGTGACYSHIIRVANMDVMPFQY
ncbi:hypothetical protein [Parabacteroides goldsteinii]|uniref:hypothetical protein n=1 Tax=Parabacteroides goldsteinii TaxID=328812 RepID=UPI0015667613|nr:hypothetical protein [Parabacteroides goldsteinii]